MRFNECVFVGFELKNDISLWNSLWSVITDWKLKDFTYQVESREFLEMS